MRRKIQKTLLGILLISLFVSPSTLLAKKPPQKDIAQQFIDFMGKNVNKSFDMVSKKNKIKPLNFRLTLSADSQITSSISMDLTNATITGKNINLKDDPMVTRTVSVSRIDNKTIKFITNEGEPAEIVVEVSLTRITTKKKETVLDFKSATMNVPFLSLNLKKGKIIFKKGKKGKKGGNAPPAFSTRSKLTTIWAKVKTQQ